MEALFLLAALAGIISAVGSHSSTSSTEQGTEPRELADGDFRPVANIETNPTGSRCWICGRENDGHKH